MSSTDLRPSTDASLPVERHPWEPFIPPGAKILILGTFPPKAVRWAMDFYYPNPTNDFWRIMGLLFLGDKNALYDAATRSFRLADIKRLLIDKRIAMSDTARAVRRLRDNASDKYLEIIEPAPLADMLADMPECRAVAATGEKAAGVVAEITGCAAPRQGTAVAAATGGRHFAFWRMPSTSRAYPLSIEKKAESYRLMFEAESIIPVQHGQR